MRPGQNKRMRGRPTNNRRGPNPLTRSYESNGPDVKIRGNAYHVAEKYLQLARDAHTGGDPVAAENYLQHAEHYFRLIASAQAAQLQAQSGAVRAPGEAENDEMDDDDDVGGPPDRFASPAERAPVAPPPPAQFASNGGFAPAGGAQPAQQPYQDRPAYDNERPKYNNDRGGYQGRNDRPNNNRQQQDRGQRPDRPYQDRSEGRDNRDNRGQRDGRPRDFRPYRDPNQPREALTPVEPATAPELPSFITAPPRVVVAPETDEQHFQADQQSGDTGAFQNPDASSEAPSFDAHENADRGPMRGRRRRPRPQFGFDAPEKESQGEQPLVREESNSRAED
jgi:Domain of unknown function (DUF4167)